MNADSATELQLALVQAELRWQAPEANRRHLSELMDTAPGADLYVLPETFTTGFLGDAETSAEPFRGPTLAWMQSEAAQRQAAIVGSLALSDEQGQRRNRMVFMPPNGDCSWYDKRHLFAYGGEDQRYTAGVSHQVVAWRGWRFDLQVCYDLRFPVWCRNTRNFDVQLFVANWPTPRVEAWRLLLRARAVENQAFVIGVNRTGQDGKGVAYPGRSSAWDGGGACLLELGGEETVARVSLDRGALSRLREDLPFLRDADRFSIQP
ncbi:MAG: nitrilase-related carbon-nitrogen hydrolase [Wenzhouxiangella sp.]